MILRFLPIKCIPYIPAFCGIKFTELESCDCGERDAFVCGAEDNVEGGGGWGVDAGGEDCLCVGGCEGGEEGGGVEGAGVEEVR